MSDGRLIVGVGAGGTGGDATVLGLDAWTTNERVDRFEEFVGLLDELLREPLTTRSGVYYGANNARMLPGTVQQPRPPIYVAATGRRGMKVAAQFAQGWVTTGSINDDTISCEENVRRQLKRLDDIFTQHGRDVGDVATVLLDGFTNETPLASLDAFVDWAGRFRALGVTELVLHWPEPDSPFDFKRSTFEEIALEGLQQLGERR
jgi:alkanesulfonate monooxygenase SsuD/methylene tetrahydromethanopterin reductase-like flavin-dependent oxidoreductase (luciferase family)